MSNLKEESLKISGCIDGWRKSLEETRKEKIQDIAETTEDMRRASEKCDLSENAEYTSAIEKLSQLYIQLSNIAIQIQELEGVECRDNEYNSIGQIVIFSTFKIEDEYGEEFIFKLYPGNLSRFEDRILAKNSRIGQQIYLKGVGDEFTVPHRVTGELFRYKITEVY